jgi:hypothetical protein
MSTDSIMMTSVSRLHRFYNFDNFSSFFFSAKFYGKVINMSYNVNDLDDGDVFSGCRDTRLGNTYHGYHYLTVSGRLCQRWDEQRPHNHSYTDATYFPDAKLGDAANFCRNPDDDPDGPWCFTMDPDQQRETCNIPICSG